MKKHQKRVRVALVMPNHADINSSLNNYMKTYQHLVREELIEVTLLTDENHQLQLDGIKIEKMEGIDYGNVFGKVLFFLGIPRFFYPSLGKRLAGYDTIVSNNPEFYAYAYQTYMIAKKKSVRLVLRTSQTVEGFFLYKVTKYVVNIFARRAYAYASYNVFSNPEAQERCLVLGLIEENDQRKCIVTGHATDTECFRPLKVVKPTFPVLLSVGGLYKLKGHQHIIKALKKLHGDGFPSAQLWIVGRGDYENNLRLLVRNLGLQDNVRFLGQQSHEELVKTYNTSTVFVLANEQEITPAVNEALACEVPVVVMECGGVEFVLPTSSYGLVSRKFDVSDMASKIKRLLKNKRLSKRIAVKGRKRVLGNFSIPIVADKYYKTFGGKD